jgi:RNA polymerase sigma factor (sigma-70 family)
MDNYQKTLFPYAYNILGMVDDARDAVQEVLTRYYSVRRMDAVRDEKNYLIKAVINQAINQKKRNSRIVSPEKVWLPEPVATEEEADRELYLKDILSYSLMVLMEKLPALERAVFILAESFEYPHRDIAAFLSITEEYSRKLLSRAKGRLFKPAASVLTKEQKERASALLENYIQAIRQRDIPRLENILADDIAFYADGGPGIRVLSEACTGMEAVAALLLQAYERFQARASIHFLWINHQPAFLFYNNERLTSCLVFEIKSDYSKILQINSIVDPTKLKNLEALSLHGRA